MGPFRCCQSVFYAHCLYFCYPLRKERGEMGPGGGEEEVNFMEGKLPATKD